MLEYKVKNLFGGNVMDRFVSEDIINGMAKDGWKLVSIAVPPNTQNNRWVSGTFVRDVVPATPKVGDEPKRGPGRPPKVATEEK